MAYRALCRILEARTGLGAFAFYERRGAGFALRHATDAYRNIMLEGGDLLSGEGILLRGPALHWIEPTDLGLRAAVSLVQPIIEAREDGTERIHGFIAAASRRTRRTGARLREALRDAADVGLHLLAPPGAESGKVRPDAPRPLALDPIARIPQARLHDLVATLLRARERGTPLTFVMIDIDRFGAVNEAIGAEAGDSVLAETGERIRTRADDDDGIFRLEGDRFLFVGTGNRGAAPAVADGLLQAVMAPLDLPARRLSLSASLGVVVAEPDAVPFRLLMQLESALRRAKSAGGGRVEVHEPALHAAHLARSLLELDLRHALGNDELSLVYQPILDLSTGLTSGVEALLRWAHPTRGEIPPSTFIPLAEATGQILPIGLWALRAACAEAVGWKGEPTLAVNISPLHFQTPGFIDEVESVLAATGFPPERLELEITESVLMRDRPAITAQLRALAALGVRIALDDFGTGYSSLAYLSRLPHHRIKLDKAFMEEIGRPSGTAGLVRAILSLARAGGIMTTAEGIERPEQLAAAKAMGFTHAQGYATGLPVPRPALAHEPLAPA